MLLWQIGHALRWLHQRGFAHLDVKPDNILICKRREAEGSRTDWQFKLTDFGLKAEPHDIEKKADAQRAEENRKPMRIENAVNYKNDFALGTWAPLELCEGKTYHVDIFVDKCSVELFVDGGRIAMTNLVFPTRPYDGLRFYSEGGQATVNNLTIHSLGL